jgi:hypothetical protein
MNKKNFVVVAKAEGIEYNIGCDDWEMALDHYDEYAMLEEFHTVYLMDNYTGELYAHRDFEEEEWGIEVREWRKKI